MFLKNILQSAESVCVQAIRHYGKHNKKYLYKDGKKYGNIIYYPR